MWVCAVVFCIVFTTAMGWSRLCVARYNVNLLGARVLCAAGCSVDLLGARVLYAMGCSVVLRGARLFVLYWTDLGDHFSGTLCLLPKD